MVKFFPTITSSSFALFFEAPTKAVVIEAYGSGTLPDNRKDIFETIENACKAGIIVCIVSQCFIGSAKPIYTSSVTLERIGVIYCGDMKPEATIAKLCYLLGKNISTGEIKKYMMQDIRGEISIKDKDFFSERRNTMIDAMLKILNLENNSNEAYNKALRMLPSMFVELTERNNIHILKGLANEIKEIYSKPGHETTPLHIACKNGNLEMVKLMMKNKINVNYLDRESKMPLNYAIENGHLAVCEFMIENGATIRYDILSGYNLCYLAFEGRYDILKMYYNCGGNLVETDYDGQSCFHVAAYNGQLEFFKFIVEETNIDFEKPNRWMKKPSDLTKGDLRKYFVSKGLME